MDTKRYVSFPVLTLADDLSSTDTTLKATSKKDWGGTALTAGMFNTDYIPATLINDTKSVVEFILIDATTIENLTTTGATIYKRGLKYFATGNTTDYDEVAENKKAWTAGSTKILIGTNPPNMYGTFANKNNDETITETWTFTNPKLPRVDVYSAPTEGVQFATKAYVDATATGTTNVDRIVLKATAGETVAAGDWVYFDDTDSKWKKTNASTAATSENVLIGVARGAGTDGNLISGGVLVYGLDGNQSGMTDGDTMYLSDTAGTISNTPGTISVPVGIAIGVNEIYVTPHFSRFITKNEQDALAGTSGTPNSKNKYATENDTTNVKTVTNTSIAFVSATSTITDSNSGLAVFRVGASIMVSGSASNDGTYTVTTVTPGAITVAESLVDESAGASITISTVDSDKLLRLDSTGQVPASVLENAPLPIQSSTSTAIAGEHIVAPKSIYIATSTTSTTKTSAYDGRSGGGAGYDWPVSVSSNTWYVFGINNYAAGSAYNVTQIRGMKSITSSATSAGLVTLELWRGDYSNPNAAGNVMLATVNANVPGTPSTTFDMVFASPVDVDMLLYNYFFLLKPVSGSTVNVELQSPLRQMQTGAPNGPNPILGWVASYDGGSSWTFTSGSGVSELGDYEFLVNTVVSGRAYLSSTTETDSKIVSTGSYTNGDTVPYQSKGEADFAGAVAGNTYYNNGNGTITNTPDGAKTSVGQSFNDNKIVIMKGLK